MKVRNGLISTVIIFLILVGVLVFLAVSSGISKSQTQKLTNADEDSKLVEAIRRGGYREAAKLKGHYVGTVDPNWDWTNFDLETLTKNSVAIVIGIPEHGKAQLSSTGDMITTDYDVRVQEVIKGTLSLDTLIKVSLPGGKVDFDDGTSAEIQTPGFDPMVIAKKYVLFLYPNRNGSNILLTTGGPQGLFELQPTGKVKAHGRPTDGVVKEVENKDAESFLNDLRVFAQRWPQSKVCCR
jgi:hypothetical protein